MSIELCWYDEHHDIIVVHLEPGWSWVHASDAMDIVTGLLGTVSHPVTVILQFDGAYIPPNLLNRFDELAASPLFTHPNSQSVMLILGSTFLRTFADVFVRVHHEAGCKVRFARSLDEAVAAIRGNTTGKLSSLNFQTTAKH